MARVSLSSSIPAWKTIKPKPSEQVTTTTDPGSVQAGNLPQAALGMPVAAVIGRKRVPDANTIWTGNLRPLTETVTTVSEVKETVDTPGGGKTDVTTTKTTTTTSITGYFIDIHMGICLGPGVKLKAIYVDNQPIWTGDVGPARSTFTIGENLTFLSKASVVFSGGAYNQAPEPDIAVADYPGYVGVATILMKNVRADLPMNSLSFEVTRIPNPLGLSDADNKSGDDVNIISALVEVMTNQWGYGGLDIANVDTVKFASIAGVIADKNNFCSVKINSETSIPAVVKSMQDQASLIVFQHPETGLITGSLIGPEYIDYVALGKRFTPLNIIEIRDFQKNGWPNTVEQARGLYTERDADYNDVPVFMQNNANASQSGRGKRTTTIQYPFVPNKQLALTLLARDLAYLAAPVYSFSMVVNRDGATLVPGDMITVTMPTHNLLNVPMCVMRVRKQPIGDNTVVLEVRQMELPDTTPLYGAGGGLYNPGFDTKALKPTSARFLTAPYYFARARHALSTSQVSSTVYPMVLPTIANDVQQSFAAVITNSPGAPGDTISVQSGSYPTFAKLNGAIDLYDGFDDGILTSITIDGVINKINLVDIGNSGVREGRLFMMINSEILSFEDVTDNGDGTWTLGNVHRALLDTTFQTHADNSDVHIVSNNFNFIGQGYAYPLGFTPDWIVTSNSIIEFGVRADGLTSSGGWAPTSNRTLSPPRPHNTKVNGAARSSTPVTVTEGASITVTWSTRSRVAGDIVLMLDAAETPETSGANTQRHKVFHRSAGGTLTVLADVVANTATFTMPNVTNGVGSIFVQAELVLGGVTYTSIAQDRVPVDVV